LLRKRRQIRRASRISASEFRALARRWAITPKKVAAQ
jgi:hypothetical protein